MHWYLLAALAMSLSIWGSLEQGQKIRQEKSGRSLSVLWPASTVVAALAKLIYGTVESDFLFTLNAVIVVVGHTTMLYPLIKHKKLKKREKAIFAVYATMLLGMIVTPHKDIVLLVISALNLYSSATQPAEMASEKNQGVVKVGMMIKFCITTAFWSAYSWRHGYVGPAVTYTGSVVYGLALIAQWYFVRSRAKDSSS